ncbi:MAG: hypothetical protein QOK48_1186 [Blastocatellia bacterium]|jgi:hypothetical protein|nr:hypothetical protein [Blastocatellia bacterium]
MPRLTISEIIVIVLALLGGLGFVFFIGTRLMLTAVSRAHEGTGGTIFAVSGGITTRLFTFLIVVISALIVLTFVGLRRR